VDSFHATDNWGDQLCAHDTGAGGVQVRYLGPRGGLKGVMELSAEQSIALAEFLAPRLSAEFLALRSNPEGKEVMQ